jgi:hypothetical protein
MSLLDQVSSVLKQYTGGGTAAANVADAPAHFEQVAQTAPMANKKPAC